MTKLGRPFMPIAERVSRIRAEVLRPRDRWRHESKAKMLKALDAGHVSVPEVLTHCGISCEELSEWFKAYQRAGQDGLRIKKRIGA